MSVGGFVVPLDWRALGYHLGGVLELVALTMVPCAVVAVIVTDALQAALFACISAVMWSAGWLSRRRDARDLKLREALVITALAYPVFAVAGGIAFLSVAGPVDAFFEAMSGFTTTGLSVMDPTRLPPSLLFFRAVSQWIGGAGIIVLSLVILTGHGSSAAHLYASEFGQENILGNVVATARSVGVVYIGLTVAGYLALVAAGAGLFDGLLHALALLSTGGFSTFGESIGAYDSALIATVTVAFMVIGATSFPLFYVVLRRGQWRNLVRDVQLHTMAALLIVGVVARIAFGGWQQGAAFEAIYQVVSAVTTTGFVVADPAGLTEGAKTMTVGLMVVGGAVGSTAGGLKLLRLAIAAQLVRWTVLRLLLPAEVKVPLKIGSLTITGDELRRTFALAACYVSLLFLSALSFMALGIPAVDAFFETASAIGTVGQSVGVTSPDLPTWAKLVLCVNMWAGRVEILPVLVMLHPRNL